MQNKTLFKNISILVATVAMISGIARVSAMSVLEFGDQGSDVYALQVFLADEGFFTVEPTGNFYGFTLKALQGFQRAHGLLVTGVYDEETQAVVSSLSPKVSPVVSPSETGNPDEGDGVDSMDGIPAFDQSLEDNS